MRNTILNIKDIRIGDPHVSNSIVERVNIELKEGQTVGVVGESGCGKSITGLSIMGLLPNGIEVLSGEILFHERNIVNLSNREMSMIRGKEISMIFQEPLRALHPLHKVGKQIEEVLKLHTSMSKQERKEKTIELMNQVGIPEAERRYYQYPHQLSGGLNQRVMIAMAIAANPAVIIADEPTTALDVTIQAQILQLLRRLKEEMRISIMLVSHDLAVICENCDYIYVMYCGQIVECADVEKLFEFPAHPYTQALIQASPDPEKKVEELNAIPGTVPSIENMPEGCRFAARCSYCMERCKHENPQLYERENGTFVRCFLYDEEMQNG